MEQKSFGASDNSRLAYLTNQIRHELAAAVGAGNVSSDPEELSRQASDWSWTSRFFQFRDIPLPTANLVVRPSSIVEVEEIVRIASDYRMPIIPRGGGSGTQGGVFAPYGGISLDLSRMNRIINIDTRSLIVEAQAGIDGLELETALNAEGLTLAHYPGSLHSGATLGGYISARGSGVVSTKYGKAEDLVLQVETVIPPGKSLSTLPVPNHAAGPGLLQLLVGAEGTLGIITKASMRLDPLPQSRVFLSFRFRNVFEGLEAGRAIMTARWRPAVIRLYDEAGTRNLNGVLDLGVEGVVMVVMCDGDPNLTEVEAKAITKLCLDQGAVDLGPTPAQSWWEGKYDPHTKANSPAPPMIYGTTDTCCTFDKVAELYKAKKATIEDGFSQYGARYTAHFSHWYPWGTMVYDRFYIDEPPKDPWEAVELHDQLWDAAVKTSLRYGGVINEHHGVGIKLGRFMRKQYGEAFPLLQGIKAALDPDGILNPGKLGFGPPR